MSSKTLQSVVRSQRRALASKLPLTNPKVSIEGFGKDLFKGEVAKPYLEKQGLPANALESADWVSNGNADKVSIVDTCMCYRLLTIGLFLLT